MFMRNGESQQIGDALHDLKYEGCKFMESARIYCSELSFATSYDNKFRLLIIKVGNTHG